MRIFKLDAFTNQPFSGNPAAVCLLAHPHPETWMQAIAQEMNVSETAFICPVKDGFNLRWFTPVIEVDLCGHATLATAHILWEANYLTANETAKFHTKSGLLTAKRKQNWIELNFPAEPAKEVPTPEGLLESLGINQPVFVGKNRFDYLVEIDSEEMLRNLKPDFARLATIQARGVMVTSQSQTNEFDFISRFFAPQSGIDEDPVTGSAHCCLGPHWQQKLNKSSFNAFQASRRGGVVKVRVSDYRVYLQGQSVIVMRGELMV